MLGKKAVMGMHGGGNPLMGILAIIIAFTGIRYMPDSALILMISFLPIICVLAFVYLIYHTAKKFAGGAEAKRDTMLLVLSILLAGAGYMSIAIITNIRKLIGLGYASMEYLGWGEAGGYIMFVFGIILFFIAIYLFGTRKWYELRKERAEEMEGAAEFASMARETAEERREEKLMEEAERSDEIVAKRLEKLGAELAADMSEHQDALVAQVEQLLMYEKKKIDAELSRSKKELHDSDLELKQVKHLEDQEIADSKEWGETADTAKEKEQEKRLEQIATWKERASKRIELISKRKEVLIAAIARNIARGKKSATWGKYGKAIEAYSKELLIYSQQAYELELKIEELTERELKIEQRISMEKKGEAEKIGKEEGALKEQLIALLKEVQISDKLVKAEERDIKKLIKDLKVANTKQDIIRLLKEMDLYNRKEERYATNLHKQIIQVMEFINNNRLKTVLKAPMNNLKKALKFAEELEEIERGEGSREKHLGKIILATKNEKADKLKKTIAKNVARIERLILKEHKLHKKLALVLEKVEKQTF